MTRFLPINEQSFVGHQVLVIYDDGDTSRVATSILRAKNIKACNPRHAASLAGTAEGVFGEEKKQT